MYCNQTPPPEDSASAKLTLKFLEACNKIFERGLLSHDKVTSPDSHVVTNITEGFKFFSTWLDGIYAEGLILNNCNAKNKGDCLHTDSSFCATENCQKKFLSWQSKKCIIIRSNASVIDFS